MLSYDLLKKIIEDASKIGISDIVLSGGEPLLYKEFIEVCKYILDKGFNLIVATNGTIFSKKLFLLFHEYQNISIQFSLIRCTTLSPISISEIKSMCVLQIQQLKYFLTTIELPLGPLTVEE
jgi:organic radical activating enzyme